MCGVLDYFLGVADSFGFTTEQGLTQLLYTALIIQIAFCSALHVRPVHSGTFEVASKLRACEYSIVSCIDWCHFVLTILVFNMSCWLVRIELSVVGRTLSVVDVAQ